MCVLLCVRALRKEAGAEALDLPELQKNCAVRWSPRCSESPVLYPQELLTSRSAAGGPWAPDFASLGWNRSLPWQMIHGQVSAEAERVTPELLPRGITHNQTYFLSMCHFHKSKATYFSSNSTAF